MAEPPGRVADPPGRPLLVFDGSCDLCRRWARRLTPAGGGLDGAPWQEIAGRYAEIPEGALRRSVHLIEPDGAVVAGAEAVVRALARARGLRAPLWIYRHVPGAAALLERLYRIAAAHRGRAGAPSPSRR